MRRSSSFEERDVILDACCLLNVIASERLLPSRTRGNPLWGLRMRTSSQVLNELLYLRQPDPKDALQLIKQPIDVVQLLRDHQLERIDLKDDELATYVDLATKLDDGEAACLAIARHRHWAISTDDVIACRIADELGVAVLQSTDLVYQWAQSTSATKTEISSVISNIRRFARFTPRSTAPHLKWWAEHSESE